MAFGLGTVITASLYWVGCGLENRGFMVRFSAEATIFVDGPDMLCFPPSLLFNGYKELFCRGLRAAHFLNMTTRLVQVDNAWICSSIFPYVVTGTTLRLPHGCCCCRVYMPLKNNTYSQFCWYVNPDWP